MHHPPAVWDGVLRQLSTEMPEFALEAWIRPLAVLEGEHQLRLVAPSPFHRERVRSRFLARIQSCASRAAGRPVDVTLELAEAEGDCRGATRAPEPSQAASPAPAPVNGRAPAPHLPVRMAAMPKACASAETPEKQDGSPSPETPEKPGARPSPETLETRLPAQAVEMPDATAAAEADAPRSAPVTRPALLATRAAIRPPQAVPLAGARAEASTVGAARPAPEAEGACAAAQPKLPYSFESFVVGPGNALAREASLAVAQGRQLGVSPLFLVGPPGTGKSHLVRALVHEAHRQGRRTRYASAEAFTSQLMTSIRGRKTESFKQRFRKQCDLLVLEDVQFLEGKAATQLELFHTVEHLRLVGKRVVLTGDRLPRDIQKLDGRLASQMTSGLVAEIELPDRALRRAILREKASRGGVRIPEDCLDLLVDAVRGNVRDLEGVLIQLVASASLLSRRIDRGLVESALRKVVPTEERRALGVDDVVGCVAGFFGVTRDQLASRSRRRDVLVPRQLAMYLCRRYTDATLSEIGRALGRDHPAVANAIRVVERGILERAPLRYQVEELAGRLER